MSDQRRTPRVSVFKMLADGFASIGKAAATFTLVPQRYTIEEMQDKVSEDSKKFGLTLNWDQKSDQENLASDLAKIGNDFNAVLSKPKHKLGLR